MKKTALFLVAALAALALFGWLLSSPPPREAPPRPKTIALVQLTAVDARTVAGFKAGLAEAGWREGETVVYLDTGPVGSLDRLDAAIRAHLDKRPDLIMVSSTPATHPKEAETLARLAEAYRFDRLLALVSPPPES